MSATARMLLTLAAVVCAAPDVAPARVLQNMAGSSLYRHCTATADDALGGTGGILCLGYLTAISDILATGTPIAGHRACLPSTVDEQQLVDVVKNYIQSHPATRHLPATTLVSQSLSEAFPCAK